MTCPGRRTCSASLSVSGSRIDLMLVTGNRVSVPSASTIRYGLLMNSSSLSCLAAALAPCCGKPNEALVPSMKVIVSARLSSSDMGPPVAGGPILKLLLRRTPHLLAHAGAQSVAFLALARLARLVALRHPLLGLRIAFRRVLALRAQLLAHAVAALGVGLAFARLARLCVRLAALGEALLAGLRVLALGADLALHAAAALLALLALAGLADFLARFLPGSLAFVLGGLRVQRRARREQGGAEDCGKSHETFSFGE